eukprot:265124-Pleurochrysis_carterae.AAC.1
MASMWDRVDILKIKRVLQACMAPTAGAGLIEILQMTYTSRWATSLAILLIADLLRVFQSVMDAGCVVKSSLLLCD